MLEFVLFIAKIISLCFALVYSFSAIAKGGGLIAGHINRVNGAAFVMPAIFITLFVALMWL